MLLLVAALAQSPAQSPNVASLDWLVGCWETERLRLYEDRGGLVYEAHPSEQKLTLFTLRVGSADTLVFENAAHDFPQRIT